MDFDESEDETSRLFNSNNKLSINNSNNDLLDDSHLFSDEDLMPNTSSDIDEDLIPIQKKKKRKKYVISIILGLCIILLWTAYTELLTHNIPYHKPFFSTYIFISIGGIIIYYLKKKRI